MNVLVLIGFFALQIGIGLWASRRVHSEQDYFVAGKSLGAPLLTMSLFATWFGAESCVGASGVVYDHGLAGGRFEPFGYALCLLLAGLLLARPLSQGDFTTLGDLFRQRAGPAVERAAILLLVPSSLLWGAAQVRALGLIVAHVGGFPLEATIAFSGLGVIAYSFLGGMWGDVMTDLIQGTILTLGLVGLLGAVLWSQPWSALSPALVPDRFELWPTGEGAWIQLDRLSIPILGSLVTQELAARLLGAKSPSVARKSSFWAAGLYFVVGSIPVFLGLVGPALVPNLGESERLLPELAARFLTPLGGVLFSCSLLAAILSTVDSVLLSNSALLSHNLLTPLFRIQTGAGKLWLGRIVLVLSGLFALAVAVGASGVYALVESASAIGTAGVLVVTLAASKRTRVDSRAALWTLAVGLFTTPALRFIDFPAPFLASVALSALTLFVGLRFAPAAPKRSDPSPA